MSKRLQVVLSDGEYREMQKLARKNGMTVSQWVRRALDEVRRKDPVADTGPKLAAVREAAGFSYPTGDIEQMLAEIERGRFGGDS